MMGLTADAGDNFKKRASIPLAPCILNNARTGNKLFTVYCLLFTVWLQQTRNQCFGTGSGLDLDSIRSVDPDSDPAPNPDGQK